MPDSLTRPDFTPTEYARFAIAGARAEIERLAAALVEARAVLRDLKRAASGRAPRRGHATTAQAPRKRRPRTPAERRAIGRRMKAYWKARRAATNGAGGGA